MGDEIAHGYYSGLDRARRSHPTSGRGGRASVELSSEASDRERIPVLDPVRVSPMLQEFVGFKAEALALSLHEEG